MPDDRARVLDEVLGSAQAEGGWVLPALVEEKGWLAGVADRIREYLGRWFEGGQADPRLVKILVEGLLYGAGALLLAAALFLILRGLHRLYHGVSRRERLEAPPGVVPEESRLLRRITQALAEGRLAEAGRLRWKLFLERSRIRAPLTPAEYASGKFETDSLDRLLFGTLEAPRPVYEGWDQRFEQIEKGKRGR